MVAVIMQGRSTDTKFLPLMLKYAPNVKKKKALMLKPVIPNFNPNIHIIPNSITA